MCFQWGLECEGGPNITGTPAIGWKATNYPLAINGAFYAEARTNTSVYQPSPSSWYSEGQQSRFSAAKSDSTYKASSTVQPASVRLLACIKI